MASCSPAASTGGNLPHAGAPQDYLYVGVRKRPSGYKVLVYDTGSLKAVRSLSTENGNSQPMLLAFDPAGNLYASSQTFDVTSTITVYARASTTVLRTIKKTYTAFRAMAFDASGNLYVLEVKPGSDVGTIVVYAAGTSLAVRAIPDVPAANSLALDDAGNLYVANPRENVVTVYAAGSDSVRRLIRQDIVDPSVVLLAAGNLYVANGGHKNPPLSGSFISDFEPATAQFPRVIRTGGALTGLAFDAGILYAVGNDRRGDDWVAEYRPPDGVALRVISQGIRDPQGIALDGAGNLYVANVAFGQLGAGNVAMYAPGTSSVLKKIVEKDSDPVGPIAIGP